MMDKINPMFKDRLPAPTEEVSVAEEYLYDNIYDFNYDNFSFLFDLLEQKGSLMSNFAKLSIDSIDLLKKYNGSNCAGLTQYLSQKLQSQGVESIVIPSFGEETPMPENSAYAGVKTTALMIRDKRRSYILESALAVENAIPVYDDAEHDNHCDTDGAYAVSEADSSLLRLYIPLKSGRTREIHFQRSSLENPDSSMQKNWLRARTRYKLCRRRPDGSKDFIDYSYDSDKFNISLGSVGIVANSLDPDHAKPLLVENGDKIEQLFGAEHATRGFENFIKKRQEVMDDLLIPSVKASKGTHV